MDIYKIEWLVDVKDTRGMEVFPNCVYVKTKGMADRKCQALKDAAALLLIPFRINPEYTCIRVETPDIEAAP